MHIPWHGCRQLLFLFFDKMFLLFVDVLVLLASVIHEESPVPENQNCSFFFFLHNYLVDLSNSRLAWLSFNSMVSKTGESNLTLLTIHICLMLEQGCTVTDLLISICHKKVQLEMLLTQAGSASCFNQLYTHDQKQVGAFLFQVRFHNRQVRV